MKAQVQVKRLMVTLGGLSPERIAEVADFVDFLKAREQHRALSHAAFRASEPVLAKLWKNSEGAAYDAL